MGLDALPYATYEQKSVKCRLRTFPACRYLWSMSKTRYNIEVSVQTRFLDDQSDPDKRHYLFAYTVTVVNSGLVGARLMSRHWRITDAHGKTQDVRGEGVVGEQPWLKPGERFEYTSSAALETNVGSMHGSYQMLADDGTLFEAPIAAFTLSIPRTLH
jgi:ApaG protein